MHRILVEEKRWIGEDRFLHALNYCMLLPGPEAQQLATYIGWLMHRTAGRHRWPAACSSLPGVIAIMALSMDLRRLRQGRRRRGAVLRAEGGGARRSCCEAVVRIGKRALKNQRHASALAAAAFVGIFFFDVPFPLIMLRRRPDRLLRRARRAARSSRSAAATASTAARTLARRR